LKGGADAISIIAGGEAERVTHAVKRPAHVRVEQSESGADMTLRIKSSDGVMTLVRLRPPALSDMSHGVVST
jgi:hypothetical protein